jgi:ribosomal protein S12 methylthiotransferase accessory factor
MFSLTLDGSPRLDVQTRHGVSRFAMDGSAPNPFEGALATIAGCAGVYAHKACLKAGVSPSGIRISLKPSAAPGGTELRAIVIQANFPEDFPAALVPAVLASIDECPVKELIRRGNTVDFSIVQVAAETARPA